MRTANNVVSVFNSIKICRTCILSKIQRLSNEKKKKFCEKHYEYVE